MTHRLQQGRCSPHLRRRQQPQPIRPRRAGQFPGDSPTPGAHVQASVNGSGGPVDGEDGLARRRTTEEWLLLHERVASSPRAAVVARARRVFGGRPKCARGARAVQPGSLEAQLLLGEPVTGLGHPVSPRGTPREQRATRARDRGSWPLAGATLRVDRRGESWSRNSRRLGNRNVPGLFLMEAQHHAWPQDPAASASAATRTRNGAENNADTDDTGIYYTLIRESSVARAAELHCYQDQSVASAL
ncbi:uncharacterized protein LOC142563523 [Dermacentor variabilis]|uniref:uncharacterized protein LOC142563523 n=1 Tax=Dermacentor variabilis TaxID=34621 RepID=UPI003F5AEC04